MSDPEIRGRLVAAARDVLLTDGYPAATVDAVLKRAGVSARDFERVFAGRQELVLAALEAHWRDLSGFLDQAFDPALPPLERLRRFTEGAHGFQEQHWARLGCVVGCLLLRVGSATAREEGPVREQVAGYLAQIQSRLETTIRQAQAEGKVRSGDPSVMAWTLVHFVEGVLGLARIQNDVRTLQGMLDRSLEFLGAEPPLLRR